MRLSASSALKTRRESQKLQSFSKMWKVNDRARVFYPVYTDPETGKRELLVAAVYGHQVDMQNFGVKTSFIPTHAELTEYGEVVVPDALFKFSQIAKLFIDGEKQRRLDEFEKKDWDGIPQTVKSLEFRKIEDEYDTAKNLKAIGPVIRRLTMLITTECLYVPMVNDKPVPSDARVVAQPLSNGRIMKLLESLNGADTKPDDGCLWHEVSYSFTSASNSRPDAGKAEPVGVNPEYRLSARYPDAFAELRPHLDNLPTESSTIERRSYSFREIPEADIMQAIQAYCIMHAGELTSLPGDSEETLYKNAKLIFDLKVPLAGFTAEQRAKLEAAAGIPAAPLPTPAQAAPGAPTLSELLHSERRPTDPTDEVANDGEAVEL
jgi:hypothetical protein